MGGRLKPGVSLPQAAAELETIGRALEREYPVENRNTALRVAALSRIPGETGPVAGFLVFLMGIVTLVLAIACANVAGALLARATERRREIAMRLAVGAGRGRIVRQLMTEALLLFVISAVAGLVLAFWMTSLLVSQLPTLPFPIDVSPALDSRVVVFTIAVSLCAALLSGLAPALQASKGDLGSALKQDSRRVFGRLALRHALVVAQVALSVLLVIVAALFVRALHHVGSTDPGFDPKGVELASLDLSLAGYTSVTAPVFARELVERVRELPGVQTATIAAVLPGGFEGLGLGGLSVAGVSVPDGAPFSPVWNIVEPGYFATLRMPLLAGRDFSAGDRHGAQPVVILGEGAARRFWPGQNAVGRYVQQRIWAPDPQSVATNTLLVIGIARDPKFGSLVDGTTGLYAYVPLQQEYVQGWTTIVARAVDGRRLAAEIRALVSSVDPRLPITSVQTADEYAAMGVVPQRVAASVAGSLGFVGLLLAGIGIYGLTAYAVASRTREIGIRLALGARRADVVRMVLRRGMSLTAGGVAIGLILGSVAGRLLAGFLFGVSPMDRGAFGGSASLFAVIGLIACYVPVRRATRIEAMEALRYE